MMVGVPNSLETLFEELNVDVIVLADFKGPQELELKALAKVLIGLGARDVFTFRLTEEGIALEEGLIIPPWRKKSLEGSIENVSYAIMPFLVNRSYLLWFQSYHPQGGVPDIMISLSPEVRLKGNLLSFSEPAWKLSVKGRLWRASGLSWKPDLVIEVKRSAKEIRPYPAKVSKVVFEKGRGGTGAVQLDQLDSFISRFLCTNGT